MTVSCPVCGQTSQDVEFCDHCNSDLTPPAAPAFPHCCPVNAEGIPLSADQVAQLHRPESFIYVQDGSKTFRAHWIGLHELESWKSQIEERVRSTNPALPPGRLVEEDQGTWVLIESAGGPLEPWKAGEKLSALELLEHLAEFLTLLVPTLESLHQENLVWSNFHPRFLEKDPGRNTLWLANLDLEIFHAGTFPDRLPIQSGYSPPEICWGHAEDIGPRTDVFHLGIFCYYWLARLLPDGFPGAGLEAFHYQFPSLRIYQPQLPPGIIPVLNRALALEPRQRYAGPRAFLDAFQNALERIAKRYTFTGAITWEIGAHTRTGRTKTAMGRSNEDSIFTKLMEDPPRALVAVADGITTCDVGSGALASLLTTLVLEHFFDQEDHRAQFRIKIIQACNHASQTLLDWALEKGFESQLRAGRDLMGTTLNAGWLEGREITLANLGDSRAYLVEEGTEEQLTVDGDIGSRILAEGATPEQTVNLGGYAKALHECIGGCLLTPQGILQPLMECVPTVTTWPLLPGDVVVLCSDGLVEEGVFLEPEILGEILRKQRDRTAQELAVILSDAADALQRTPSVEEPEGFGDNISCIVIRVREKTA